MIIYVMGAGRSGTTLLDIVIGSFADVVSMGEARKFFDLHGVAPRRPEGDQVVQLWQDVYGRIPADVAEAYRTQGLSKYEYHSRFLRSYTTGLPKTGRPVYRDAWAAT